MNFDELNKALLPAVRSAYAAKPLVLFFSLGVEKFVGLPWVQYSNILGWKHSAKFMVEVNR